MNDPIEIPESPIITGLSTNAKLEDYISLVLDKLKIVGPIKEQIIKEFSKYDTKTSRLMDKFSDSIDEINKLIEFDDNINKLIETGGKLYEYISDPEFKKNWDKTMVNLSRLQGLIILRRVSKDCKPGIDAIIKALDDKLIAVNNIIETELEFE
jgi:hypothetical protein